RVPERRDLGAEGSEARRGRGRLAGAERAAVVPHAADHLDLPHVRGVGRALPEDPLGGPRDHVGGGEGAVFRGVPLGRDRRITPREGPSGLRTPPSRAPADEPLTLHLAHGDPILPEARIARRYPTAGSTLPDRAFDSPDRATNMPERTIDLPERAFDGPDRATNMPERTIESPERAIESPERAIESPERAIDQPDAGSACPSGGVGTPDWRVGLPDPRVPTSNPRVHPPNAATATIADGPYSAQCQPLPTCDGGTPCDCATASVPSDQCSMPSCSTMNGGLTLVCHYI